LNLIAERESANQMSVFNLAVVFGPTLLCPPPPGSISTGQISNGGDSQPLQDTSCQVKAIETILEHYKDIFIDENEGA